MKRSVAQCTYYISNSPTVSKIFLIFFRGPMSRLKSLWYISRVIKNLNMMNQKTIKEMVACGKRHAERGSEKYSYYQPTADQVTSDLAAVFLLSVVKELKLDMGRVGICKLPKCFDETFLPNGKPWWRDRNSPVDFWTYVDEKMQLTFYAVSENRVCLQHIEVFETGKGQGTELMNTILDLADQFGIDIELVPVAINDNGSWDDLKQATNRLRKYYWDFEFKPVSPLSALLVYKSK